MARQGRQHEGAVLVLNRLERRLLEVISSSAIPAMPVADIKALPVHALADPSGAFLWLWTTNRYLRDGLEERGFAVVQPQVLPGLT